MRHLLGSAALLAVAAAVLLPAAAAVADTSDFTFDSFDADYTITRADDGTSHLDVVETIVARFPDFDQNRGIIRAIPSDYDGVDLGTVVNSVTDEKGAPVPFETSYASGFVDLALGTNDFVHGAVTYVISYSQQNVVRSFQDTHSNEFYWDINGTGWAQPFGRVSAMVHVDPSLVQTLTGNAACYVGPQGSTTTCPIGAPTGAAGFSASATNLGPGETLTVAIGFAQGTFVTPTPTPPPVAQPLPFGFDLLSGGLGVLSLAALGGAIAARVHAGRGARGRGIIVAQYSEPKDVTILQAAHLMHRAWTAMPAAIVRLAVRKNLRILAYATAEDSEPYSLQYLGADGTNAEDRALLDIVFGENPQAGAVVGFGQSNQPVMTALAGLSDRSGESLVSSGLQRKPGNRAAGVLLVVAQVVMGIVALGLLVVSAGAYLTVSVFLWPTMLVGTAAFIATAVLARRPLQLTDKGADARDYLLGMQVYLTLAEKDRLRALQSPDGAERVDVGDNLQMVKLYEKLLPWAVLWGVEDQWMKELAVRVEQLPEQPDWFIGANGFNAALFSGTVHGFSAALAPPATSWGGSGGGSFGGGSFGGGFSGGGGGGGGGGGR
ncbi:MAG: hypothetical protein JWP19_1069 [Rhodoglobus sp.]|nr:hypothetical protein [Rhodoglobus sp.]